MATDANALLIDSVFIARLVECELYGAPAEGLSKELRGALPNGLRKEHLESAAESLIRTHSSGAFPKMPVCLRAIRNAMAGRSDVVILDGGGYAEAVTDENFSKRAIAFGNAQRLEHGRWPVAYRYAVPEDTSLVWADWQAWQAYFKHIKSARSGMIASGHKVTVPCINPQDFDLSFVYQQ